MSKHSHSLSSHANFRASTDVETLQRMPIRWSLSHRLSRNGNRPTNISSSGRYASVMPVSSEKPADRVRTTTSHRIPFRTSRYSATCCRRVDRQTDGQAQFEERRRRADGDEGREGRDGVTDEGTGNQLADMFTHQLFNEQRTDTRGVTSSKTRRVEDHRRSTKCLQLHSIKMTNTWTDDVIEIT